MMRKISGSLYSVLIYYQEVLSSKIKIYIPKILIIIGLNYNNFPPFFVDSSATYHNVRFHFSKRVDN